jgi:hypothetical protein
MSHFEDQEQEMKLTSTVSSDHETSGCDYALIDLSPDLASLALNRVSSLKALKRIDPQLDEIYFWDYHVEYFSPWNSEEVDRADSLGTMIDHLPSVKGELVQASDDFVVPEDLIARVECPQMIAHEEGISFIAIPKHASHYIRTAEIPFSVIESVAVA